MRDESPLLRAARQADLSARYRAGSLARDVALLVCVIYTVASAAAALLDWIGGR